MLAGRQPLQHLSDVRADGRLEAALLHDWFADAVREPIFCRRPPALAQAQQERPFEIAAARVAKRRHLPLGREVMKAQLLHSTGPLPVMKVSE